MDLSDARVLVTGGAGFLGRRVCALIAERGAQLVVPRRAQHDLTEQAAVRDLLARHRPHVVIHLAAEVGGIGANRANPGRYFYANAAMGLHLIEEARRVGVDKFVQVGTVCSYPKHTPIPFSEEDLWNGYPEETNAAYGVAKKALLVMLAAARDRGAPSVEVWGTGEGQPGVPLRQRRRPRHRRRDGALRPRGPGRRRCRA
ncbi:hypothetical protein BH23ACT9_BH23ACT9_33730 [soil metagenome]